MAWPPAWQRRCQRWLANRRTDAETLCGPLIPWAIQHWPGQAITLGLWGPGDVISSEDPVLEPLELQCLTTVVVEHIALSADERHGHLRRERQMLAELHAIQRIRSGERRLLALLHWIGRSFGQVNSRGCRLSLSELNLTHRSLADLCGLTRVTVTKILGRFRQEGQLVTVGENDLLLPKLP